MALWGLSTASTATPTAPLPACTPFELPSGGAIVYNASYTSTLTQKLTFQQPCDDPASTNPNSTIIVGRDPFYASTSPQIFAIATATVISYLLVIIILITPRSLNTGRLRGSSSTGLLGRSANSTVVGVGRRPWLQKIATITVAISLTIATADTFRVAQEQYDMGYTDANLLVDDVVGSLEIRVVRVISDTFLWLAQVQTLIRLFPRHKEKVTIKWLGFALVSLDTIFSILDDFVNQSVRTRPRSFQDAIPALAYLFELAISLIYASCVIYYSLSKRRFAFWHNRMRNICLIALLSLIAVLIPVVFFVLDVSKPDVAGWGDYIRWVGGAAASVVVWEWVERIEALEKDERKDGILGREIFDGDEMLDDPAAVEADFPGRRQYWNRHGFPTDGSGQNGGGAGGMRMRALRSRIPFGNRSRGGNARTSATTEPANSSTAVASDLTAQVTMPAQAVSPISRSDTTSAGSTIYAVRYHTVNTPAVRNPEEVAGYEDEIAEAAIPTEDASDPSSSETAIESAEKVGIPVSPDNLQTIPEIEKIETRSLPAWRTVMNPFKRRRASPPAEIAAQIAESGARRPPVETSVALRERFASAQLGRAGRSRPRSGVNSPVMAVTVIPAQRRAHRTRSPDQAPFEETNIVGEEPAQHDLQEQQQASNILERSPSKSAPSQVPGAYEMPVVVIPAPRRGQRTWSPEDAYTGPVLRSPVSSPVPPDPPPDDASTRSPVYSMRGSLMISEDQARSQPLRSTYARGSPGFLREHDSGPY